MNIEEYFRTVGISKKRTEHATKEHRRVSEVTSDSRFYKFYFKTGLDEFLDGVDIEMNKILFDVVLNEVKDFSDIFEPYCQSGLLGCYIAANTDGDYRGVDINAFGIKKAKARAELVGVEPENFVCADVLNYHQQHDIVVGRYALNTTHYDADETAIDALCKLSDNIVLIQGSRYFCGEWVTLNGCRKKFSENGYSFTQLTDKPIKSEVNDINMFVVKATKC